MGTRLKRIVLKGFRSIREADIELKPINLLIGANGAGKSNFLGFFSFIRNIFQRNLQFFVEDQGGPDKLLHFGRKYTPELEYRVEFDLHCYEARLEASTANQLRFNRESIQRSYAATSKPQTLTLIPMAGSLETGVPADNDDPYGDPVHAHVDGWRVYHFHDTSSGARVKHKGRLADNDELQSDASNLAAFLLRIRLTPAYAAIVSTIQRVAPFFRDFILTPEGSSGEFVRLRWAHRGSEEMFEASDLSDGTLRFICLVTLLLQPEPPDVIILDEPELGLHPFALKVLAGLMRSISARAQIVVSTQSVTFANQFGADDIIVVDRDDEASRLRRLQPHELDAWLDEFDYGIGDLWEKNIIGGTP
jgi:predicted ATPase